MDSVALCKQLFYAVEQNWKVQKRTKELNSKYDISGKFAVPSGQKDGLVGYENASILPLKRITQLNGLDLATVQHLLHSKKAQ